MNKTDIVKQCLSLTRKTLIRMAEAFAQGKMVDDRTEILLASLFRAIHISEAIERLDAERPYAEEMAILLRSLAELVVNAIFLQKSSDEEVESFRRFDTLMLAKSMRLAEEFIPGSLEAMNKSTREKFDVHAQDTKQALEDTATKASWTKKDLQSRAVAADKQMGVSILEFVSRVVYPYGHTYTHSSFSSMDSIITIIKGGDYDVARGRDDADHALFGASQTDLPPENSAIRNWSSLVI